MCATKVRFQGLMSLRRHPAEQANFWRTPPLGLGSAIHPTFSSLCMYVLGRHVCRTKLPPKNFQFDTKNGLKNAKKRSEKRSETCLKKFSGRLKMFHRHFSTNFKSFSQIKTCTKKKYFFTARLCRGSHAK